MHPVIGFLAAVTVTLVVVARPTVAGIAIPALGTGAVVALPQAATMLGCRACRRSCSSSWSLAVGVTIGVVAGPGRPARGSAGPRAGRSRRRARGRAGRPGLRRAGHPGRPSRAPTRCCRSWSCPSWPPRPPSILRAPAARSPVVWAALAAGFAVAALTQLVPATGAGLLGDALRFELPKTLQYWVPVFVALLAARGWRPSLRGIARPSCCVGSASSPSSGRRPCRSDRRRSMPSISASTACPRRSRSRCAGCRRGSGPGYPDSRYVVDAPRQALLDAVRAEIAAGRLGPDTQVLHVAGSFQQWVATPLGVFDGVTETDVVPDVEVSIHTVGGRLRPLADLPSLLAEGPPGGRTYGYVVLEPSDRLPTGTRDAIVAAGYRVDLRERPGGALRAAARAQVTRRDASPRPCTMSRWTTPRP